MSGRQSSKWACRVPPLRIIFLERFYLGGSGYVHVQMRIPRKQSLGGGGGVAYQLLLLSKLPWRTRVTMVSIGVWLAFYMCVHMHVWKGTQTSVCAYTHARA